MAFDRSRQRKTTFSSTAQLMGLGATAESVKNSVKTSTYPAQLNDKKKDGLPSIAYTFPTVAQTANVSNKINDIKRPASAERVHSRKNSLALEADLELLHQFEALDMDLLDDVDPLHLEDIDFGLTPVATTTIKQVAGDAAPKQATRRINNDPKSNLSDAGSAIVFPKAPQPKPAGVGMSVESRRRDTIIS